MSRTTPRAITLPAWKARSNESGNGVGRDAASAAREGANENSDSGNASSSSQASAQPAASEQNTTGHKAEHSTEAHSTAMHGTAIHSLAKDNMATVGQSPTAPGPDQTLNNAQNHSFALNGGTPAAPGSVPENTGARTAAPEHTADLPEPASAAQQPLRSVSLEFAPDGAQDVRVRVSERGGDVHISLHSTDPALSGRLRDGVQDLAGALNSAGYNADAWSTNDRGRQQQRDAQEQAEEQRQQQQRRGSANTTGNEFSGMMLRTDQEAS